VIGLKHPYYFAKSFETFSNAKKLPLIHLFLCPSKASKFLTGSTKEYASGKNMSYFPFK